MADQSLSSADCDSLRVMPTCENPNSSTNLLTTGSYAEASISPEVTSTPSAAMPSDISASSSLPMATSTCCIMGRITACASAGDHRFLR